MLANKVYALSTSVLFAPDDEQRASSVSLGARVTVRLMAQMLATAFVATSIWKTEPGTTVPFLYSATRKMSAALLLEMLADSVTWNRSVLAGPTYLSVPLLGMEKYEVEKALLLDTRVVVGARR